LTGVKEKKPRWGVLLSGLIGTHLNIYSFYQQKRFLSYEKNYDDHDDDDKWL